MPNDPETVKLLQQMLEELRKNREYREQTAKAILETRLSSDEHERRVEKLRNEAELRRQEDAAYRTRLHDTLDRLIQVISEISTKLDKQG